MKLLYGTRNRAKIKYMKEMLHGFDVQIVGLDDVELNIGYIDESGNNPLDNAIIKANKYYEAWKMPVFSCDSGLYIEGLDDKDQPGIHVRRINGKELNDEEMIKYYSNIAEKLGGSAAAKYKNAICLITDEDKIYKYDGDDISSESFLIVSKPHPKRTPGFPLDSLSVDMKSGRYYMDLESENNSQNEELIGKGFRDFFARTGIK